MDSKLKGAFTLSEEEWVILAFGLGVPSIFGFPKTNAPPDRESVIRSVSGLVNKKYIEPQGDHFKVFSPYRDAVLRTGGGKTLYVRSRSDRLPDFVCYAGDPLLLCEPMPQKSDVYRFAFLNDVDLWERLQSAGYFPEDESALGDEPDLNTAKDMEEEFLTAAINHESLDAFSPVVFWTELITEGKRSDKSMAILEHPLFRYILINNNGEKMRRQFDSAQMHEVFFDFLREADA